MRRLRRVYNWCCWHNWHVHLAMQALDTSMTMSLPWLFRIPREHDATGVLRTMRFAMSPRSLSVSEKHLLSENYRSRQLRFVSPIVVFGGSLMSLVLVAGLYYFHIRSMWLYEALAAVLLLALLSLWRWHLQRTMVRLTAPILIQMYRCPSCGDKLIPDDASGMRKCIFCESVWLAGMCDRQ